jgi:uncharacterized membrane protein YdjX (TVP38/TMEM64 family)
MQAQSLHKLLLSILLISLLIGGYLLLKWLGIYQWITDTSNITATINDVGIVGPLIIIGLMALAIVFSPLPSAPIALAAGSLYGHTFGTVYIIVGALIGSLIAFLIARYAGRRYVQQLPLAQNYYLQRISSQNSLTLLIFISRLVPFISFDLVSYAAGLTPITLWRFTLATLLGLIPASFLLAHFGGEMARLDNDTLWTIAVLIGLITIFPILYRLYRGKQPRKSNGENA